jgi:hypothetical protein
LGVLAQNRTQPDASQTSQIQDIDEMERWLSDQPARPTETTSLANSDFERFLEERAKAAENLPDQKGQEKKPDPFGL